MAIQRSRVLTGPLNERQREILMWVASGQTHAWTAGKLGVSRVCVSENMRIVVAKLGVANSAEAIHLWGQYGSYQGAARALEQYVRKNPANSAEEHVNHVLTGIAAILRTRADKLIPPQ